MKKYIRKSDQRADRLDAARATIPKEAVKIIARPEDALYCLMIVLAIDAVKCSQGH